MEMIILGLRSDVLDGQLPWYCLSCFTCLDRCPQKGDAGETMFAIRNLAVRKGNVPEGILDVEAVQKILKKTCFDKLISKGS